MPTGRRTALKVIAAISLLTSTFAFASPRSRADTEPPNGLIRGLVNIDTPEILEPRSLGVRADLRVFGGQENTTYFGLGANYGLSSNWELGIGSSIAQFEKFTMDSGSIIRHGGSDVELTAKYATKQTGKCGLSWQVGVGLPNTPAQHRGSFTAGITGSAIVWPYLTLYINPRVVFITDNTLVGLGIGAKVKITRDISFVGDYTAILGGANTIDTSSGGMRGHDVYGAAFRYTPGRGNLAIDLGYTNGTGFTTGTSLTSGLGSSGSFFVAVNLKR